MAPYQASYAALRTAIQLVKLSLTGTDNQPGLGRHTEDMRRRIREQQLELLVQQDPSSLRTSQEEEEEGQEEPCEVMVAGRPLESREGRGTSACTACRCMAIGGL